MYIQTEAPTDMSVTQWFKQFRETESVEKKPIGRPKTSEQIAECIIQREYRIWGTQHPNKYFEYVCDTPKVNTWCELLLDCGRTFLSCGKNHYCGNLPGCYNNFFPPS
jgi:hypothetical protein